MPLLRIAFLAAVVMVAADGVGHAWENTPLSTFTRSRTRSFGTVRQS